MPGLGGQAEPGGHRVARGGRRRAGGAFALRMPFGLMACPACTPLLMPLALGAAATAEPLHGATLLGVFGLGRGVPIVVLGTFTSALQTGGSLARGASVAQRALGWCCWSRGLLRVVGAVVRRCAVDARSKEIEMRFVVPAVAFTLLLAFSAVAVAAETEQVTVKAEGMYCVNCEARVESALAGLDGVQSVTFAT